MQRSARWIGRGVRAIISRSTAIAARQMLFGIVQGGTHAALRRESADALVDLDFPGYAIGGLAVGESHASTCEMAQVAASRLPADRPRYLMGVGKPEQISDYVALGVDMMDCVLPTRSARHGCLFTSQGRVLIRNAKYANDPRPIDESCECAVCRRYSRAYLRHFSNQRRIPGDHLEHPPQHPLLP